MENGGVSRVEASPLELPPPDLPVTLLSNARLLEHGRLLVGGSPLHALRVTDAGSQVLAGWRGGGRVGDSPAQRSLARRLLERDLLCPHPDPVGTVRSLTVVVPVRDRLEQLARCLESLRASCPESEIIVVDDGSAHREATRALCAQRGVTLIGHNWSEGAAAARNTGLRACATTFVAFVDSDVVVPSGWAHQLLAHFADPCVGAIAPRVRALPSNSAIGGYEERHSSLDMGNRPGCIGPGRPIPYVPAATLIVRRQAANGGFDPSLPIGEDIDFVWRLTAAGWRVRYVPEIHVWHDHRDRLRSFLDRRRVYAVSVALLARRHPDALPAVRLNTRMAIPWALALLGHRLTALAAAIADAFLVGRGLRRVSDHPYRLAGMLVGRGLLGTGEGLAQAVRRAWAPALVVAALRRPKVWLLLASAFTAPVVHDALMTRDLRVLPADTALRLIDEIVALWGTWEGCLEEGTIEPLLPRWNDP
jgi:mycofactocin system glycosyltransferase